MGRVGLPKALCRLPLLLLPGGRGGGDGSNVEGHGIATKERRPRRCLRGEVGHVQVGCRCRFLLSSTSSTTRRLAAGDAVSRRLKGEGGGGYNSFGHLVLCNPPTRQNWARHACSFRNACCSSHPFHQNSSTFPTYVAGRKIHRRRRRRARHLRRLSAIISRARRQETTTTMW